MYAWCQCLHVRYLISKIKLSSIPFWNFIPAIALIIVPTYKIYRVGKVIAVMAIITSRTLIDFPGFIFSLRIAISARQTSTWDKAQNLFTRWLSIGDKARLLMNKRHHGWNRRAPVVLRIFRIVIPASLLIKYCAYIIEILWRRRGTGSKKHRTQQATKFR